MNRETLSRLNGDLPIAVQIETVMALLEDQTYDPSQLCQPGGKICWGNAALVLLISGWERSKNIIPKLLIWGKERARPIISHLFDWIRDMRRPGAFFVLELLYQYSDEELLHYKIQKYRACFHGTSSSWVYFVPLLTCEVLSFDE